MMCPSCFRRESSNRNLIKQNIIFSTAKRPTNKRIDTKKKLLRALGLDFLEAGEHLCMGIYLHRQSRRLSDPFAEKKVIIKYGQ